MILTSADWAIIVAYFIVSFLIGAYFTKRAGSSLEQYFISGRSIPWWLAGTSMVATTFAADTPLAVTGMTARNGVAGNWLWWSFAFSGMLTVTFFSRLWRRAGVMTDVELAQIRYSGPAASFLRGFRALYLALPINLIILGWVNLGMAKVIGLTLGIEKWQAVGFCFVVTAAYSVLSGIWGVLFTDFFQFLLAMFGSISLAWFAVDAVGGMPALKARLVEQAATSGSPLSFFPEASSSWMPLSVFLVYIGVNWWAVWYPGAEPGGGGFATQRMLSTIDERHSYLATLWFNIAHYGLRSWPWILVALCTIVLYPNLADRESGYIRAMIDHVPPVFRGIMLASFAAAYMSTISSQLNLASSYLINDFYRPFVNRTASDAHYVMVSRLATVVVMLLSGAVTFYMNAVEGAWKFLMALGAGTGLVYILRWYWWRINAWSEVSAMVASFVIFVSLQYGGGLDYNRPEDYAQLILYTALGTTVVWVVVTYLTRPVSEEVLLSFYKRVRPSGRFWRPVAERAGLSENQGGVGLADWLLGCGLIYCTLFGLGKMLLLEWASAALLFALCFVVAYAMVRRFQLTTDH